VKHRNNDPGWDTMTTIARAEYCEKIADTYRPGFCKDQVLAQARQLREMAGREAETKFTIIITEKNRFEDK